MDERSVDSPDPTFAKKLRAPYMNYSAFSDSAADDIRNSTHPTLKHLDAFDEEDWDISMSSGHPTEFDMRPDLTPTGDNQQNQHLRFSKPDVRGSPSLPTKDRTSSVVGNHVGEDQNNTKKPVKNKSLATLVAVVRTSIISCLILIFIMSCLLIVVIESDSDLFSHVRKLPEMVILRKDYYQPLKTSLIRTIRGYTRR